MLLNSIIYKFYYNSTIIRILFYYYNSDYRMIEKIISIKTGKTGKTGKL